MDWNKPTRQIRHHQRPSLLWILVLILLAGLGTLLGILFSQATGFKDRTLWDWLELLSSPLALIAGIVLLRAELRRNERQVLEKETQRERHRQYQREVETNRFQETVLQAYLDRMAGLLFDRNLRVSLPKDEVRALARASTLAVLRELDGARKGLVVRFLYEGGLLHSQEAVVSLKQADLRGVDLSQAELAKVDLSGADLSGANLRETNLREANLEGATLIVADLSSADLQDASLNSTKLTEAVLVVTSLIRANLSEADLHGANLEGANLTEARLYKANVNGTVLSGADLTGADLGQADLHGANLEGADLREANLYEADLIVTNLAGADLIEARLTGTKITANQLHVTKIAYQRPS